MIEDNKRKIFILGGICFILVVAGILYYFSQNTRDDEYMDLESLETNEEIIVQNEIIEEIPSIIVHISGNVVSPGVISLEEGSRLIDAINKAGGFTAEADISKVNLAYILEDAQKIYIPSKNDKDDTSYISEGNPELIISSSGKVGNKEENLMININSATQAEFEKLPGIGSSIATRIVSYRKENGKFNTIEDIKNVSGIGEAKFNNIKNFICVK